MLKYDSQNNIIVKNTSLNMVSKKDIKLISSLKHKKFRDLNSAFVVEGRKSISEFLNSSLDLIILISLAIFVLNAPQSPLLELIAITKTFFIFLYLI